MPDGGAEALALRLSHLSSAKDVAAMGGVAGVADAIARALAAGGGDAAPAAALLTRGLSAAGAAASARIFGVNRLAVKPVKPFWDHFKEAFEDRTLQVRVRARGGGAAPAAARRRRRRPLPSLPRTLSFPPRRSSCCQRWCRCASPPTSARRTRCCRH